jgi:NitT/TauT family transport system permease protein
MSLQQPSRQTDVVISNRPSIRTLVPPLLTMICVLLLWLTLSLSGLVNALILPNPVDVLRTLVVDWKVYAWHTAVTTIESLGGFVLALLVAVIVSVPIALVPVLDRALTPWIVAGQAFPKEALSPLLAVWLGYGMVPKGLLSGMICFFPIAIALIRGLLSNDSNTVDMLRVLGASRIQQVLLYLSGSITS